jgi:hypothetical protein
MTIGPTPTTRACNEVLTVMEVADTFPEHHGRKRVL